MCAPEPLLERREPLELLTAEAARARTGSGRLVLLRGATGTGRTVSEYAPTFSSSSTAAFSAATIAATAASRSAARRFAITFRALSGNASSAAARRAAPACSTAHAAFS
ncbi:P-loop NTPase family protein [Streptomyces scabiei]|uniref:hypothetical protein n=1 Tax=Streptomyces scabiei TaxID=1930 RepID=UPI000765E65D|nr:hypothetical protein [Streptomyces scabiei]